jgi:hypothetical protein
MFLMPFSQSDKPVKMFSYNCTNYESLRMFCAAFSQITWLNLHKQLSNAFEPY